MEYSQSQRKTLPPFPTSVSFSDKTCGVVKVLFAWVCFM